MSKQNKINNKLDLIPNISEAVLRVDENEKMRRRHNLNIENMRTQKRTTSVKTNALRIFNELKGKRALQKSKIRLLTSSKHYRKVYYEHDGQDSSCGTSSGSSEDLDHMINDTKMLIEHLDEVGHNDNIKEQSPMFEYDFDAYYHFRGYRAKNNCKMVLGKLCDLQKILKSKKRLSIRM